MFGRQEIFSVSWHGARPPLLDLPTRRELNRISQEAQPTMHEVIVLEPDAEMHETATPDNETTEGMTQPAEKGQLDRDAGQKRKRSDEDASSSEIGDLLQKVEYLEKETKELKKRLLEEQTLSKTLSTSLELARTLQQLQPQQEVCSKDNACEETLEESPRKSARNCTRNRLRRSAADSLVQIGEGVTVKEEQLEEIWKIPNLTATKFVRKLCQAVFTPEELQGKCLRNKGFGDSRKVLDPIRLGAIIDYTCSKFKTDRSSLRVAISCLLYQLK